MRENTDQKKSEYKHFPRSDNLSSKSGFTHHYTEIANIELLMQNLLANFPSSCVLTSTGVTFYKMYVSSRDTFGYVNKITYLAKISTSGIYL